MKKKKHFGITMDLSIYHPQKNITTKELDKFANKVIELVEKNGWSSGGGWGLVDLNIEGNQYIHITPKHIKNTFEQLSEP